MIPLFEEHHAELALYQGDIALDPEYELYEMLERKNSLVMYTVRLAGALAGYAVYFVRPHHHYRRSKWAFSDIVLVRKQHRSRGLGDGLFEFLENDLRAKDVDVMHTSTKIAHPELGYLLSSRGHELTEACYSKRL